MTKKEIIKKLKDAGVEFDENATIKDLHSKFPEILTESEEEDEKDSADVKKITFKIRNIDAKDRESFVFFTPEKHGPDFVKVADEFGKTNEKIVLERKSE